MSTSPINMDTGAVNVLLFGDQTIEKLTGVRALAQQSKSVEPAARFLAAAADALHTELRELPSDERADVDDFNTILGLAEANAARAEPNETIATALMAVVRLGELIVYANEDPTILGAPIEGKRSQVIGLCTGQLSAAVAVAARDTSELFALAVETTRIAFRLGREVCRNSRQIDPSPGTWATTIVGLPIAQVQQILDDFHTQLRVPPARHISVGVEAQGWLTVFGPPSTQLQLWEWSTVLAQASRIPTEARGGVHIATMPPVDADRVLGSSPLLEVPLDARKAGMNSTLDGALLDVPTLGDLLRAVLPNITHQLLRLNDTLEAASKILPPGRPVRLVVLGPTGHTSFVQKALSERGHSVTLVEHSTSPQPLSTGLRGGSGLIAIVGMSGRFPGTGSAGIDGFWETLHKGERHVTKIPPSRFDLDKYFDATGEKFNSTLAGHGAFLEKPGLFDHRLFNVSPREALQMDPVHRLFLTTSYEALEMAGYYPDGTPATRSTRMSTFFGQVSDDHREILANEGVDIYYIPGIVRAFGPGRVNYHFKWGGGAFSIDSACAASTTAISLACRALNNRDCDTALAGGASVLSSPWPFAGLSRGGFLSLGPGGCNTFHDEADGYCRGEAAGVVVLKRLEDAIADNDNILGVIPGVARNYSSDAASITHPSATAQQRLYQEILHKSATDPNTVSYVEMHGTGTQAGDFVEMSSVLSTFGRGRSKENPLVVGAVKANIGHGEAAAGISSLIKALLILRDRRIPPQPEVPFKVNSKFPDLNRLNVRIATESSPLLPAADGKRRVFVNSFDAAGGNTCLLLEEGPPKPYKSIDPRPCHVVTLSARTPASLAGNKQRLLEYLKQNPAARLADLAYTTTARRMHGLLRTAFVVKSTAELMDRLSDSIDVAPPNSRGSSTNVVFTFTGQGSLYAGMGKALWKHSPSFRSELESFQALADLQCLPKFTHLIYQDDLDVSTASAAQAQLAIVALEIALAHLFQSLDVQPSVVIGHSLGEYAALCVAGVLSTSDTLYLVATRAAMMEDKLSAHEYAMLAVSEAESAMHQRLGSMTGSPCEIACINAPNMTVVSGAVRDLEKLQENVKSSGARATLLRVPYGFHSKQIEPILNDFEQCAKGVVFSKPTIPVASTLLGDIVTDGKTFSAKYLCRQAREPVSFVSALEKCKSSGFIQDNTMFMEMGPEPVCLGLVRSTLSVPQERLAASLKTKDDDWAVISSSLAALYTAGISVKWPEYHKHFVKHLSLLELPFYAFDEKEFWVPFRQKMVETSASETVAAVEQLPHVAGFPTSSLQRLKSKNHDSNILSLVFESNPYEPNLLEAIRGHAVAGVTICPSSVFCDMALSAAKVAYGVLLPKKECPSLAILDLSITHPLIVSETPRQKTIEVTSTVPDCKNPAVCKIGFILHDETGAHDMGGCSISYKSSDGISKDLSRTTFLVHTRIEALQEQAARGFGHRLSKPVVYRLFQNLVDYAPAYQGLQEVVLDGDFRDAFATVKLPESLTKGNFMFKPHLLDAAVHLFGFFENCGLKYPEDVAFLTTAMDEWHLFQPLSEDKTYTSYVHMEEQQEGSLVVGDVYVFHENTLVAAALGIKSQKMKKSTMRAVFQSADSSVRQSSKPKSLETPPLITGPSHHKTDYSSGNSGVETDEGSIASETPATSIGDDTPSSGVVEKLLDAVAAESGADKSEMTPDALFADLGVDSLMTIAVLAAVRNATGVELPGTFLLDHPTIGEAMVALGGGQAAVTDNLDEEESLDEIIEEEYADEVEILDIIEEKHVQFSHEDEADTEPVLQPEAGTQVQNQAKVILLQGSTSSDETPVFLLADITGRVSPYTTLPALASGRKVYGVESPFSRDAQNYNCTVEALAQSYATAIRQTHPAGPYLLAGFSTGAIHAFEVCRQLSSNIQGLCMIDMPAPADQGLAEKITDADALTYEHLQQAGVFIANTGTARSVTLSMTGPSKQHTCATVKSLLTYQASPLPTSARPQRGTVLVVGSTGPVLGSGTHSEDKDALVRWAHGRWNDEGDESKGWAALVGGQVKTYNVEASHIDMFRYPKAKEIGSVFKEVMESVLG